MEISKGRITSIIKAKTIGFSIEGINEFSLPNMPVTDLILSDFPSKLRLGKQVEKFFSAILKSTHNYEVIKEGLQIMNDKITIGELDFIVKDLNTNTNFHLELVYKFYLYNPKTSDIEINKWIGPNQKDSLIEKINKLKTKQFPLLNKVQTQKVLADLDVVIHEQRLCFMANLYVPFKMINDLFSEINNDAIVGYWLSFNDFLDSIDNKFEFYLPSKFEWGINPKNNSEWVSFVDVKDFIVEAHQRQFSPLCWIKKPNNKYEQCFVVWW